MRSKKKKLLFICFSALIMVGLCIGVFADYNSDRLGTIVGSTPYDLGDLVYSSLNSNSFTFEEGYYIAKVTVHSLPDVTTNIVTSNYDSSAPASYISFVKTQDRYYYCFNYSGINDREYVYLYSEGVYYIYVHLGNSTMNYVDDHTYCDYDIYTIASNSIDIYDNSQDVWSSVVSVVNDATDSIINTDILLLFAAALPVLSFGVGMLIRLFHKS